MKPRSSTQQQRFHERCTIILVMASAGLPDCVSKVHINTGQQSQPAGQEHFLSSSDQHPLGFKTQRVECHCSSSLRPANSQTSNWQLLNAPLSCACRLHSCALLSAGSVLVQGQVHVAVQKLLAANAGEVGSITTTGHSLGGALASMCAFDIAWSGINKDGDQQWGDIIPVTAFTFEAPRVGGSSVHSWTISSNNPTVTWGLPPAGRPGSHVYGRVDCPGALITIAALTVTSCASSELAEGGDRRTRLSS